MLRAGLYKKALVVGFETFNRLTLEHFHAMNLLAQNAPYQPFSEQNQGIVLGEGIGCVALTVEPAENVRQCEIIATSQLTDNHNLTNSQQSALQQLVEQCLQNAQLTASQIQGVKVHAVGVASDEMELAWLQRQFPQARWLLAKPYLGHTLGASGALETAWFWQMLQQQELAAGYYLNYFIGFGGSNVAWIVKVDEE